MKRINAWAVVCSVVIIMIACSIGATSVSALSAEGQGILSELASVGTSLGINIGDFVSTTETTTQNQTSAEDAEEQLGKLLASLGADMSVLSVTDMISYLNSGKSFSDWVCYKYGDSVEIPESVRTMSTKDVVLYLLGTALYPAQTTETTTADDHIFSTTETQRSEESSSYIKETETESGTSVIIYPTDATAVSRKTGDVNDDGKITAADARLVLRASAGLELLTVSDFNAADVNGDGVITAKDARSVLRYAAGVSSSF